MLAIFAGKKTVKKPVKNKKYITGKITSLTLNKGMM